ncbi:hypothetical protein [Escherichia coli]|uniref:hypothetical protein n=1 Tax=Escherichia coli TaxID=562 RepID=UPI000DEBE8DA|nr:hypothetical protein [Escherichia coli]
MLGGADNPNGELLSYIIGADILERCKYIPCGSRACAYCSTAQQLHYQGVDVTGEYALYQLPELFLDFLETNDKNSSYHWDYNKLVERHEDAQARSFG